MAIELEIEFHTDSVDLTTQDRLRSRFQNAAQWVVERFHKRRLIVSIAVVDDPTIQRLNGQHLQHDWPTDCLSFVFEPGESVHGEVIVSWDTASRLSSKADWSPEDEVTLYVVHGMLHLVGLDDSEDSSRCAMRLAERDYLLAAGIAGAETYLDRFDDVSY